MGDSYKRGIDYTGKSLIQKAIRRGDLAMTEKAFYYLVETGQFDWLRRRLPVIIFEECWSYALNATFENRESVILTHCLNIAKAVKNKNAAGLGEMVYACFQGIDSITSSSSDEDLIRELAVSLKKPEVFWSEISKKDLNFKQRAVIIQAESAFKKANYDWDKATVIAGAYLAYTSDVPEVKYSSKEPPASFPFWVAVDKHTPEGKNVLQASAEQIHLEVYKAKQLSFYFEGAQCIEIQESPWWEENVALQIKRLGFNSITDAEAIWNQLKPIVMQKLKGEAEILQKKIQRALDDRNRKESDEPSLF